MERKRKRFVTDMCIVMLEAVYVSSAEKIYRGRGRGKGCYEFLEFLFLVPKVSTRCDLLKWR